MLAVKAGVLIVSVDAVYEKSGLLIDNGLVKAIMPNDAIDRVAAATVIDLTERIVFPGFINAHMHQYGLLAHGIPAPGNIDSFESFLKDYWWPLVENRIRLPDVLATTYASAIELIRSGVTGFCDTLEAPLAGKGVLHQQALAIERIGMRAILSLESCERLSRENGRDCLEENAALIRWADCNSRLVQGAICTHTTFTGSADFLQTAQAMAEKLSTRWQLHFSESRYEPDYCQQHFGKTPGEYYHSLGLLGPDLIASQCVQISGRELELLVSADVKAVHMPLSNCEVGGGIAPVPQMLASGMTVGLGTDGYVNDFFEVMRGAFLIHKAFCQDPRTMPARQVFRMATELGAKALGWARAGTLLPGQWADFVAMKPDFPTPVTLENVFDQIVVFGRREYIDSVFVAANPLLLKGILRTIDERKVLEQMRRTTQHFWEGV
ncbi:MAG: amidohydrolase family protein [Veillonellaceae bacterium]|nr:amidohydrolase family protein [Veillonellaceae bacterium]